MSNLLHPTMPAGLRRRHYWYPTLAWRTSRARYFLGPPPNKRETLLTVQKTTQQGTGIIPVFTTIEPYGNTFKNAPNATIQVINNSGQAVTVTITAQQPCNQQYLHNYSMTVQSFGIPYEIGPFDFHYNDGSGLVHIGYTWLSGIVSGITIAVVSP